MVTESGSVTRGIVLIVLNFLLFSCFAQLPPFDPSVYSFDANRENALVQQAIREGGGPRRPQDGPIGFSMPSARVMTETVATLGGYGNAVANLGRAESTAKAGLAFYNGDIRNGLYGIGDIALGGGASQRYHEALAGQQWEQAMNRHSWMAARSGMPALVERESQLALQPPSLLRDQQWEALQRLKRGEEVKIQENIGAAQREIARTQERVDSLRRVSDRVQATWPGRIMAREEAIRQEMVNSGLRAPGTLQTWDPILMQQGEDRWNNEMDRRMSSDPRLLQLQERRRRQMGLLDGSIRADPRDAVGYRDPNDPRNQNGAAKPQLPRRPQSGNPSAGPMMYPSDNYNVPANGAVQPRSPATPSPASRGALGRPFRPGMGYLAQGEVPRPRSPATPPSPASQARGTGPNWGYQPRVRSPARPPARPATPGPLRGGR